MVGLPPGLDEQLRQQTDPNGAREMSEGSGPGWKARKWAWSGKYAVAQFHDGRQDTDEEEEEDDDQDSD